MAKDKPKYTKGVSPAGICIHPRLNNPDTKFDDNGTYHVVLAYDPKASATKKFLKEIDAEYAKAIAAAKANGKAKKGKINEPPYSVNEETGQVEVSFKAYATFKDKQTQVVTPKKLALFDAAGQPFDRDTIIGGGTKGKAAFYFKPYETPSAGVKLTLTAFQVLDLVEYSGGGAESYGFSVEEQDDEDEDNDGETPEGEESEDEENDDNDGEF